MSTKITLARLGSSLRAFGKAVAKAEVIACRKAAQRARSAVVELSKSEGIAASGTFDREWKIDKEPKGAVLGNAAHHALFVERGRKPGKAPPRAAIVKWMIARRWIKMPPKSRTAKTITKRGEANRRRASERRSAAMEKYAHIAFVIAMKIKRKGFKGRWLLKRTMPCFRRWIKEETAEAIRRLKRNPPKG